MYVYVHKNDNTYEISDQFILKTGAPASNNTKDVGAINIALNP